MKEVGNKLRLHVLFISNHFPVGIIKFCSGLATLNLSYSGLINFVRGERHWHNGILTGPYPLHASFMVDYNHAVT